MTGNSKRYRLAAGSRVAWHDLWGYPHIYVPERDIWVTAKSGWQAINFIKGRIADELGICRSDIDLFKGGITCNGQ